MTWQPSAAQPAGVFPPGSFEPHTPPPSAGVAMVGATVMDPNLFPSAFGVPGGEQDQQYGEWPMMEDPLMVKTGQNAQLRPLHTYMAPLSLNAQSVDPPTPSPSKHMDMRLAQPGSEESKPGYLTPLAQYNAQTFWYFWYADMFAPPVNGTNGRRASEANRPFDNEGRPRHRIHPSLHPNQLQPNLPFCHFVYSVLHNTQVSFSVTLLALIYTYKYKKSVGQGLRPPYKIQVSEAQGFVTGLMLANKYLDDNTYTNSTWAQFLGIPVKQVNEYELEWLDALQFNLSVSTTEFETWRSMLDAHIRCREGTTNSAALSTSPEFMSMGQGLRARSASPPAVYFGENAFVPTHDHAFRKRSARDAFAADIVHNTGMYEAARLGTRKPSFVNDISLYHAPTVLPTPAPSVISPNGNGSIERASSLNRQIARMPNSRRDSASHEQLIPAGVDLRPVAAANAANQWATLPPPGVESFDFSKDERWRRPVQPRLYFLQAAATPQFGPDARYHKAIPHYWDPTVGFGYEGTVPAQFGARDVMDVDRFNDMDLAAPADPMVAQQQGMQLGMVPVPAGHIDQPAFGSVAMPHPQIFINPQPAQFANAGPPGYAYGAPNAWPSQHMASHAAHQPWPSHASRNWKPGHNTRWSAGSDEVFLQIRPPPLCNTAGEWAPNTY